MQLYYIDFMETYTSYTAVFFWILLFFCFFYAIIDILLMVGLWVSKYKNQRSIRNFYRTANHVPPYFSVLISARNEEENLAQCLDSILKQDYEGKWDIWVADDRSTDSTVKILKDYCDKYPDKINFIAITETPAGRTPKKHALSELADKALGNIFVLTDADCIVPPTWLSSYIPHFRKGVEWVSGYSYLISPEASPALAGIQALDFMSHRTIDAAAVGLIHPITACGQNLAYRKRTFKDIGGFEGIFHIVSGDDDLLLNKLVKVRPYAVAYCTDPQNHVQSLGKSTWREAWEQRKRWASKTPNYTLSTTVFLSFIFLFYLLIFLSLPTAAIFSVFLKSPLPILAAAFAFLWKSLFDFLVMLNGWWIFGSQNLKKWYIPTALIHIPLIVLAVISGIMGKFHWKDQKVKRKQ